MGVARERQEFKKERACRWGFCFVDVKLSDQEAGKGAREGEVGGILIWNKSKEAGRGQGTRSPLQSCCRVSSLPRILLPPALALLQVGAVEKLPGPGVYGQSGHRQGSVKCFEF